MTEQDWKELKHFYKKEAWGNPARMDFRLLWLQDQLRKEIGFKFVIHRGFAVSGHAKNSFHYKGMADDFHIEECSLLDIYSLILDKWWFGGVGFYPYWHNSGIHMDIGPSMMWKYGRKIRRVWVRAENNKYLYGVKNIDKIMLKAA